jgi:hypothetical protein
LQRKHWSIPANARFYEHDASFLWRISSFSAKLGVFLQHGRTRAVRVFLYVLQQCFGNCRAREALLMSRIIEEPSSVVIGLCSVFREVKGTVERFPCRL